MPYEVLVNGKWYAKTICTLGVHVLGGLIWQQDSWSWRCAWWIKLRLTGMKCALGS